jgi:hypothetical protein
MIQYYKSALQEIWQDKRTLGSRLWLPFLLFSAALFLVSLSLKEMGGGGNSDFGGNKGQAPETPNFSVGIVANGNGDSLITQLQVAKGVDYQLLNRMDTVQTMMDNGDLDLAIVIDEFFDDAIKTGNTGEIILYHDGYNQALREGILNNIDWYKRRVLNNRLADSGFNDAFINPVNVSEVDASNFIGQNDFNNPESDNSENKSTGTVFNEIGGFFLLLVFYFAFLGGIYPALTLFTNDALSQITTDEPKKILISKTLAVATFSIFHGLLFYLVAILIFQPYQASGNVYLGMLKVALRTDYMPLILLGLLPLSAVFSAFLSWSITKRGTFKEGQNRIQPLKISVGLFILMGISANFGTSVFAYLIPVMNIGTLSRLLLQNDLNWLHLTLTYATSFGIAYVCFQQASKEFEKRVREPIPVDLVQNVEIRNDEDFIEKDEKDEKDASVE